MMDHGPGVARDLQVLDELSHAVVESARDVAALLTGLGLAHHTLAKSKTEFPEPPGPNYETAMVETLAFGHVIRQNRGRVFALASVQRATRLLVEIGLARQPSLTSSSGASIPEPTFAEWGPFVADCVIMVVSHYFDTAQQLAVDEAALTRTLGDFVTAWQSTSLDGVVVAPLVSFASDIDTLSLPGDVLLARLPAAEKADWWDGFLEVLSGFQGSSVDVFALAGATHKLEARRTFKVGDTVPMREAEAAVNRVVTAMRLSAPGNVSVPVMLSARTSTRSLGRERSSQVAPSLAPSGHVPGTYRLGDKEAETLPKTIVALERVEALRRSGLRSALHWFSRVYSADTAEDAIVFLAVALESSLLSETRDELKFRLRVRAAAILGGPRGREAYSCLGKLYDVRSGILHGGRQYADLMRDGKISGDLLAQSIDVTRELLRTLTHRAAAGGGEQGSTPDMDQYIIDRITGPSPSP